MTDLIVDPEQALESELQKRWVGKKEDSEMLADVYESMGYDRRANGFGTAEAGWSLRLLPISQKPRSCILQTSAGIDFARFAAGEDPARFSGRFLRLWI